MLVTKGQYFTSNEIDHYINKIKINPKPEFYLPLSNLNVMVRMINELIVVLEKEIIILKLMDLRVC